MPLVVGVLPSPQGRRIGAGQVEICAKDGQFTLVEYILPSSPPHLLPSHDHTADGDDVSFVEGM
jgi:hypothetical protein